MDIRNAMSMAAVVGAVLGEKDDSFRPETLLNTHVTSAVLEDEEQTVLLGEGSRKKLAKERKSASRTGTSQKSRGVSLMSTTSAAGVSVCQIAIIKDRVKLLGDESG